MKPASLLDILRLLGDDAIATAAVEAGPEGREDLQDVPMGIAARKLHGLAEELEAVFAEERPLTKTPFPVTFLCGCHGFVELVDGLTELQKQEELARLSLERCEFCEPS